MLQGPVGHGIDAEMPRDGRGVGGEPRMERVVREQPLELGREVSAVPGAEGEAAGLAAGVMASVMPPCSGTRTGVPWAMASGATMPKASRWIEG